MSALAMLAGMSRCRQGTAGRPQWCILLPSILCAPAASRTLCSRGVDGCLDSPTAAPCRRRSLPTSEEPATGGTAPAAEAAAEADEDDDDFEEPAGSKSKRKANTASKGKPAKKGKLAAEPVAGTEDVEAPEEVCTGVSALNWH